MTAAKICGLTTPEALDAALDGGAAFVGAVVFPKSPRHIDPLHGATLFGRARGRAKIVAVTVDADDALLTEIALILKPDLIQLHGEETVERAARVRLLTGAGIIKVLPIRRAEDFAGAEDWAAVADHLTMWRRRFPCPARPWWMCPLAWKPRRVLRTRPGSRPFSAPFVRPEFRRLPA